MTKFIAIMFATCIIVAAIATSAADTNWEIFFLFCALICYYEFPDRASNH